MALLLVGCSETEPRELPRRYVYTEGVALRRPEPAVVQPPDTGIPGEDWPDSIEASHYARFGDAIERATRVRLHILDGQEGNIISDEFDPPSPTPNFHENRILESAWLRNVSKRARLAHLMRDVGRTVRVSQFCIYVPHHGLGVESDGRRYEATICVSCGEMRLFVDSLSIDGSFRHCNDDSVASIFSSIGLRQHPEKPRPRTNPGTGFGPS